MKNKKIYILGGQGLIGKEITKKFKIDNKVIVLDINIKNEIKNNLIYQNFDVSKFYLMKNELNRIIKKNGSPDVFVNCSYPRTDDWNKYNIENLEIDYLRKNVDLHMNSYAWSILEFAKIMKKNKIKGSIISINSIYGMLGQDENIYEKTNIKINPVYSLIKGGLISFNKNIASYYGKYNIRVNSIISGGIEGRVAGLRNSQSKN